MSKKKNLEQEVLISETEETTDAVVVTDESEVKPAKEEEKVVVFGLVLFGLDALLGFLFGLLTKGGK